MQKLHTTVLLVLMLVVPLLVFSQNPALQVFNQNDIDALNSKMQKLLKKCHCFSKRDSIRLFTLFTLETTDTISKEEYADGSFLNKLKYEYDYFYPKHPNVAWSNFLKKDSLIAVYHFILSKNRTHIATFSRQHNRFICVKKGPTSFYMRLYLELIKSVWDKENIFVFQMNEKRSGHYFFIVNEQLEISVFHYDSNDKNYKILPIKEFISENWEKFNKANSGLVIECCATKKQWRSYNRKTK